MRIQSFYEHHDLKRPMTSCWLKWGLPEREQSTESNQYGRIQQLISINYGQLVPSRLIQTHQNNFTGHATVNCRGREVTYFVTAAPPVDDGSGGCSSSSNAQ